MAYEFTGPLGAAAEARLPIAIAIQVLKAASVKIP
jgi:hypothetical protein